MYKNIYYEKRRNKIHVWDDKRGHLIVPYKKYAYVKNQTGLHYTLDGDKVKKVSFGDTTGLSIKRDDPARRRSFRARHNCDNPGPKWKARYWSCYQWRAGAKVNN